MMILGPGSIGSLAGKARTIAALLARLVKADTDPWPANQFANRFGQR
jgi:hypothetical protein